MFSGCLQHLRCSLSCVLGQVLSFKALVLKAVAPLLAGAVESGMSVFAEGSARAVGKVVAMDGAAGLAVIRLEVAFGLKESSLHVGQKDGPLIKAQRPSWWPQEWGQEQGS